MVTTAPGTPPRVRQPPPSGRNRVHPDSTIDIDGEVEGSKDKCNLWLWIPMIMS